MKTQEINFAHSYNHAEKFSGTERTGIFAKQVEAFEKNRFALMALFITLQSCIGGIASMYLLESQANDFLLMICAGITMMANALLIAQASAKTCVITVYVNIIINTVFILAYL